MKAFKRAEDIHQLPTNHPAYTKINELLQLHQFDDYDPEHYGWTILIEEGDTEKPVSDICERWTLLDVPWEGITLEGGYFICVFLANNEFGLVYVIPDAPWLPSKLRGRLMYYLDPPIEQ